MFKRMFLRRRKGFTLIELLIVVAIIGVLAGIAIPNFLTARTKAKVSREFADMRNLGGAIEMSYLDNGSYPSNYASVASDISEYINVIPSDPFNSTGARTTDSTDLAISTNSYGYAATPDTAYLLIANGPDATEDVISGSVTTWAAASRMSGNIGGGNGITTPSGANAYGIASGDNGWNNSDHSGDGDLGRGGP